jgi:hypothetical protein
MTPAIIANARAAGLQPRPARPFHLPPKPRTAPPRRVDPRADFWRCPFCGKFPSAKKVRGGTMMLYCATKRCPTGTPLIGTRVQLLRAWNRRPIDFAKAPAKATTPRTEPLHHVASGDAIRFFAGER